MSAWNLHHGSWWMIQWSFDGWFSIGLHVDFRKRINSTSNAPYGPYIDIHLGCFILSVGRNPAHSGELDRIISVGRGGLS